MSDASDIPWFKCYAAETLSDERFAGWSCEERGAFWTLLCLQWREGSIPGDHNTLRRFLHLEPPAFSVVWQAIGCRFAPSDAAPGRLENPRMAAERREVLASVQMARETGRKGAAKRWHPDGDDGGPNGHGNGDPIGPLSDSDRPPNARSDKIRSERDLQQRRGGLPLRDEARFAQWPLAAALRQRLAEEWPGLGWTKRPDSDNASVARCGLDACASACLAYGRAAKVAPESLGFFSGLLADLQPLPAAAPESLAWRRVLDAHEALPPGDQWPGIRELRGRTDGEALVVEAHSQQRADALVAIGRREWLAKLAGCPVRIEAPRA